MLSYTQLVTISIVPVRLLSAIPQYSYKKEGVDLEHKDRKFKPNYHIGELAKNLGMHPQTIRYYDKAGIVLPNAKTAKKERMFASYDAYMIMIRKQYQNMGFSVQETEQICKEDDVDTIANRIEQQILDKEKEVIHTQYILEGMRHLNELLKTLSLYSGRCFYRVRPLKRHQLHLQNDILESSEMARKARIIAMEAMPLCRHTLGIRQSDIIALGAHALSTYCDLAIEEQYAAFYGFDQISSSFLVDSIPCLYTVLKIPAFASVSWSSLDYVSTFMESNHLALNGDVSLTTIVNALDNEHTAEKDRYRYFEVWVPIKEKKDD